MNLCVIVSMLLWNILAVVEGKFYLELTYPSVDATALIELANRGDGTNRGDQSETKDGPFKVVLYECRNGLKAVEHHVLCERLDESYEQKIYKVANFNVVSDLEIPPGHSFNIDGNRFQDKLHQAVAIGVEYLDSYLEKVPAFAADSNRVQKKVDKYLARLVESADDIKTLVKFFSINHKEFMFLLSEKITRLYFARYVATLQKLIDASGYNKEVGSPTRTGSPNRSQPQPQTQSTSKSRCGYLCRALIMARIRSPTRSNSFRSISPPRSRSRSEPQSFDKNQLPRSPSRGFSRPQSGNESPSRSKTRSGPGSDSESPPRSKSGSGSESASKSPSRSKFGSGSGSDSESKSLSNSYLVEAAGMLSFKMFDPCSFGDYVQSKTAERYCAVYCQFLSAAIHLNGQIIAKECQYLKTGWCKKSKCACGQRRDVTTVHVNMVHCNNAMRLRIYQQARQSLPSHSAVAERATGK